MAFLGAGQKRGAARVMAALKRAAAEGSVNGALARDVDLPLAEGFIAFDAGDYATAIDRIGAVRGIAQRFGGSHAQRDVLSLTMLHAALRGGQRRVAEALAAERKTHKPESRWALRLWDRAAEHRASAA